MPCIEGGIRIRVDDADAVPMDGEVGCEAAAKARFASAAFRTADGDDPAGHARMLLSSAAM
jgi:hypothetical protein